MKRKKNENKKKQDGKLKALEIFFFFLALGKCTKMEIVYFEMIISVRMCKNKMVLHFRCRVWRFT